MECRYLALEGPAGVGKGTLAERLASRLDAALVLDETDTNPFLTDEGDRAGSAFQAQLFALLARHRQQVALRQADLFSQTTVSDYLFDKDKIYAYQTLDDNELFIYQRLFELLSRDVPPPDLVVYLQAPTDVLRKRVRERERREPSPRNRIFPRLPELNEAFNHFFFHYTATPLLVVETSQIDLSWPDAALDDLLRQIQGMKRRDALLRAPAVTPGVCPASSPGVKPSSTDLPRLRVPCSLSNLWRGSSASGSPLPPRKKPVACRRGCGSSVRSAAQAIYNKDLAANSHVCPKCSHHFRVGATDRLRLLFDGEWDGVRPGPALDRSAQLHRHQALHPAPEGLDQLDRRLTTP